MGVNDEGAWSQRIFGDCDLGGVRRTRRLVDVGVRLVRQMGASIERLIPGEGEFSLCELIKYVGPDMVIDVEVPLQSYKDRGLAPLERARLAAEGTRRLLDKVSSQR